MKVKVLDSYTVGNNHYGKAVFSSRDYKKGDIIVVFEGPIVHKKDLPSDLHGERDRYVQIGVDEYMGPSNTTDDLINHSCDPNTGLKFTDSGIFLIAIKNIEKGEEITWDYSTTIHNDDWKMDCLCKSKKCRGVIREFKHLPTNIKIKYKKLGILPPYLVKLVPIHTSAPRVRKAGKERV